jgi:SAM-dependent methyltransferase
MTTYVYGGPSKAPAHHHTLPDVLDQYTIPRIIDLQPRLSGLRCLDVGAGAGSVAAWLAGQVGEHGQVVATDLDTTLIPRIPRLHPVRHDITAEAVPRPPYDLIHSRLVLQHLPEPETVLKLLVHALIPGGLLLIEDFDPTRRGRVLHTPSDADRDLIERFHDTLLDIHAAAGVDPGWALRLPGLMVDLGLRDVHARCYARSWRGGEPGCTLMAGNTLTQADSLIARGMTERELARVRELMTDPRTMIMLPPPLMSTAGWRP